MNQGQKGFLQVLRRMWIWLAAHPKVTALPMMAAFVIALGAVIDELSDAGAQQDSHLRVSKGATADAQRLRRELYRDHMRLVARVAKVSIPAVVKVTAALKMPKEDIDVEQLIPRVLASTGFDYWESGQDYLPGQDVFHSFVEYQTHLLAELRRQASMHNFVTVDARGPIHEVFQTLCAVIEPVVIGMVDATASRPARPELVWQAEP